MKRITTILTFLMLLCMGAGADVTVTISDGTDSRVSGSDEAAIQANTVSFADHHYGTYENVTSGKYTTFRTTTTYNTSGISDLTITASGAILKPTYYSGNKYKHCLAMTPDAGYGTEYTITLTAPSGYYIKSYSMKAISTSSKGKFDVKPLGFANPQEVSSDQVAITPISCSNTASFTIVRKTGGTSNNTELCFPSFTVTLASTTMSGDVALSLNSNNGNKYRNGESTPDNHPTRDFQTYKSTSIVEGLSLSCSGNSMNWTTTSMRPHSNGGTFTITAPTGYVISGYKISAYTVTEGPIKKNTITPSGATTKTLISEDPSNKTIICVDGLETKSTAFVRGYESGGSSAYVDAEIIVYLRATYTVIYKVVDSSGNEMTSANVEYLTTATLSNPSAITNSYVSLGDNFYSNASLSGDPVTSVSSATTVYKLGTVTGCPIAFSTVESPTWYYLKIRDSYLYAADAEATYPSIQEDIKSTKEGAWAFIGNPYSFKIINKIVGSSKFLARNTSVSSGVANGTIFNTTGTNWQMDAHYKGNGFRIYDPGVSPFGHIYSDNTKVTWLSWNGTSNDENRGGEFVPSAYSDDFTSQVTANIKPYFDKYNSDGEVYFGITTATYNAYNGVYTAALVACTEDNYSVLYSNIMSGIKYPETGYYRLKNNSTGNYLGYDGSLVGTMSSSAVASVVKMTKDASGYYSLKVQDKYVQYPTKSAVAVTTGTTEKYLVPVLGDPGLVLFKSQEAPSAYIYLGLSGGTAMSQISSDATAKWSVEPATDATVSLTAIGGNTYATTCLPFDVTVEENTITANAVLVSDVHVGYVVPTALEDNEIPAGTPVILKGSSTSATSATLTINTGDAFSAISGTSSALEGVYVNTAFALTEGSTTDYFLGMLDGVLGFYHSGIETPASSGNYTLSANRAYLPATEVAASRGFAIKWSDDDVTGIGDASHLKQKAESRKQMFDLQGRRVENPQRGLYIVGGRKIVIK